MKESKYKSYDDLPLFLNADSVSKVLGVSPSSGYCDDRRTHQCHPSYRTIAGATGLSLNTVVKSVGVLAGVLDGKLGALGDCVGRLLFKLSVDDAVMANLVAATSDVDLDMLRKLRARCVREVKETNGQTSFEDALKFQKGLE